MICALAGFNTEYEVICTLAGLDLAINVWGTLAAHEEDV